jgi:hypothetical protein
MAVLGCFLVGVVEFWRVCLGAVHITCRGEGAGVRNKCDRAGLLRAHTRAGDLRADAIANGIAVRCVNGC